MEELLQEMINNMLLHDKYIVFYVSITLGTLLIFIGVLKALWLIYPLDKVSRRNRRFERERKRQTKETLKLIEEANAEYIEPKPKNVAEISSLEEKRREENYERIFPLEHLASMYAEVYGNTNKPVIDNSKSTSYANKNSDKDGHGDRPTDASSSQILKIPRFKYISRKNR